MSILSRVSEKLDARRMHRIHALGLVYNNHGIIIVLPVSGGKTTLAMSILQSPECGIKLLSEDSPLVKRNGALLPFPLRIGVSAGQLPCGIDVRFTRSANRMERPPKATIDIRYFADRISRMKYNLGLFSWVCAQQAWYQRLHLYLGWR